MKPTPSSSIGKEENPHDMRLPPNAFTPGVLRAPSADASVALYDSSCDDIGSRLFGVKSKHLTCKCKSYDGLDVYNPTVAAHSGNINSTDFNNNNLNIDCRVGENLEVTAGMKDGKISYLKTCARYYDSCGKESEMICVKDLFFGGSGLVFFCDASIDGKSCNSCQHLPFASGSSLGSSMRRSNYCPRGDYINLDCSNIRKDYKKGYMCGHASDITFEVNSRAYSKPCSYKNADVTGVAVSVVVLVVFCALLIKAWRLFGDEDNSRSDANRPPGYLRITRARGTNSEGRQVELVLVSLLESDSNVAVAKETIQDDCEDFQYYTVKDDSFANELRMLVFYEDWRSVRERLAQMVIDGTDNDTRSFYFSIIEEEIEKTWPKQRTHSPASFSPMLDKWAQSEPLDANCRILRASIGARWAWHARSAALAYQVSEEQALLFHARLEDAAKEIEAACRICPSDPLIYASAITIKKGLGKRTQNHSIMSVETCLDALNSTANEPLLYSAHTRALQYYCQKWHGSHTKMFSYARDITSQLPDGHALWVLIPMAHIERNMICGVEGYWEQQEVIDEIKESYMRAFPAEASFTVQATGAAAHAKEMACRNYFAYSLVATGQYREARHQIRLIGRRPIEGWPWCGIERYKSIVEALGFDTSPPDNDSTTHHLTHAVATPPGEDTVDSPIAPAVQIV